MGIRVITVEGVAEPDGALHPVQQAMVDSGGSQCGYCTPGFVVSLFCEYYRPGRRGLRPREPSAAIFADARDTAPSPTCASTCRARARRSQLAASRRDPRRASPLRVTNSPRVRFARPASPKGSSKRSSPRPSAVLIAGGTDLMVYATQRYERLPSLVSLEAIRRACAVSNRTRRESVLGAGLSSRTRRAAAADHPGASPCSNSCCRCFRRA